MRNDPGLNEGRIARCLSAHYGLRVASLRFLPIGYDPAAATYEVVTDDGSRYFLKVRSGPVHEPGLLVPAALAEQGVPNVLAPLRTRSSALWFNCNGDGIVLYPFIRGDNAATAGLSTDQWQTFGATLRAIHGSGIGERFRDLLPCETFALPAAALVRRLSIEIDGTVFASPAARRLAAFWTDNADRINDLLDRVRR